MKKYLDMDEVLRHCRRYIGQEYDEPYLVSAVPEEVIRSLPPADVVEVVQCGEVIRCGQCKHWKRRDNREYGLCAKHRGVWLNSDYCSKGEYKDGGQEND